MLSFLSLKMNQSKEIVIFISELYFYELLQSIENSNDLRDYLLLKENLKLLLVLTTIINFENKR
jgi:hypothetical protein